MKTLRATVGLVALLAARAAPEQPCGGKDPCAKPGRAGEVAIIFLGDSGYGQGGSSEWGPHAQGQIAAQMSRLCPRPDLVFFLGDNIYWKGSPDLFAPRFDTVYQSLFDREQRRVHAVLGNHDAKGCQVSGLPAFTLGETCADALGRLVREDVQRDAPAAASAEEAGRAVARVASPFLSEAVLSRAAEVPAQDCPPAFDSAYEQRQSGGEGKTCYATKALRHASFGYLMRGGQPLRYYSVDAPAPTYAPSGGPTVRVVVADSNTLDVVGGLIGEGRTDALQTLWIENQLRTAPADGWRIVAMHHPPFSPRACVFRLLGRCVGGHDDEALLQTQMRSIFGTTSGDPATHAAHRPDVIVTAHNHFYARTTAIDAHGYPGSVAGDGIRYFVTGGGGAPLYRQQPLHARYARGGSFHHFVYVRFRAQEAFFWAIDERGMVRDSGCFRRHDNTDRCITSGTHTSDQLVCGDPVPVAPGICPALR